METLTLWWSERIVGILSLDRSGAMHFVYARDWVSDTETPPLFHALPKQDEPFGDALCKAVFAGLLPEESQRTAIARALGVSTDNPFRLLEALGGDVAGALSFLKEGERPESNDTFEPSSPLLDAELTKLFERLPRVPMLAGEEGGARLSLAGAQSKLPVVLVDGKVALPQPGQPSTHIIKPEPDRFSGLAANEAFCLALAAAIGLDVAKAEWRIADGNPYLLVNRYDREDVEATIQRIHQEDFAQALGVPSHRKYAAEGGPVLRDCFALIRNATTRPAREVLKLVDAVLFNIIIGNADAHAKNYSLLYTGGAAGTILAPLYDLVGTLAWEELSPRFAMKFGGKNTLEEIEARHFDRFAEEAGLSAPFVKRRTQELADTVEDRLGEVRNAIPAKKDSLDSLAEMISDRAQRLKLKAA